jgi:hypothetical protein
MIGDAGRDMAAHASPTVGGLVKIIDVVRNRRRTHNFFMTLIRVTGSQLNGARVLVDLIRSPRRRTPTQPVRHGANFQFVSSHDAEIRMHRHGGRRML